MISDRRVCIWRQHLLLYHDYFSPFEVNVQGDGSLDRYLSFCVDQEKKVFLRGSSFEFDIQSKRRNRHFRTMCAVVGSHPALQDIQGCQHNDDTLHDGTFRRTDGGPPKRCEDLTRPMMYCSSSSCCANRSRAPSSIVVHY